MVKIKDKDHPIEIKPHIRRHLSARYKKMRGQETMTKTIWRKLRGR
jgi:hypothetical protein